MFFHVSGLADLRILKRFRILHTRFSKSPYTWVGRACMDLKFLEGRETYFVTGGEREEDKTAMTSPKRRKGSHWFIWDPCGIACAVATYIFLVYGVIVLLAVVAPAFPDVYTFLSFLAFTSFVALSIISHVKAMMTDPVSWALIRTPF